MTGLAKLCCLPANIPLSHSCIRVPWCGCLIPALFRVRPREGSHNEQRNTTSGSEDISASDHDWLRAIKSIQSLPRSEDKVVKARYDDAAAMDDAHKETTFSAHSNPQSIYMIALSSLEAKHYMLRCRCSCVFFSNVLPSSTAPASCSFQPTSMVHSARSALEIQDHARQHRC